MIESQTTMPAAHSRVLRRISANLSRLLDVIVATVGLVLLAPLLTAIWAAVRLTSPGPVLFRQTRVGWRGNHFEILKFRTMYQDSDDTLHRQYVSSMLKSDDGAPGQPNGLFKLDQDPRITRLGAFLRRTSFDELPQLVNVLRGEMALVGPRPALPWEVALYQPRHLLRLQAKPGMTGLWQVRGRNRLSMQDALELDVQYVTRRSLGLDVWILIMTPLTLLRGETR